VCERPRSPASLGPLARRSRAHWAGPPNDQVDRHWASALGGGGIVLVSDDLANLGRGACALLGVSSHGVERPTDGPPP
jgi:hypothetical protein